MITALLAWTNVKYKKGKAGYELLLVAAIALDFWLITLIKELMK